MDLEPKAGSGTEPSAAQGAALGDRLYYRIGDVAEIVGVKPYVLRYWETEFSGISPDKSPSGQRVYRRSDVEMILLIKHLLYTERYSIEGARRRLKELRREGELASAKKSAASQEMTGASGGDEASAAPSGARAELEAEAEAQAVAPTEAQSGFQIESSEVLAAAPEGAASSASSVQTVEAEPRTGEGRLSTEWGDDLTRRSPVPEGWQERVQELRALAEKPISDFFRY